MGMLDSPQSHGANVGHWTTRLEHCPDCDRPIGTQTSDEIVDKVLDHQAGTKLYLLAPLEIEVGEAYDKLWDEMRTVGYNRVRIDGQTHSLDSPPTIDRRRKHDVEVVVDRIVVRPDARSRIAGSIENALALGKGVVHIAHPDERLPESRWPVRSRRNRFAAPHAGLTASAASALVRMRTTPGRPSIERVARGPSKAESGRPAW